MRLRTLAAPAALLFVAYGTPADAKDLRSRFGIGFNTFFDGSSNLAARYVVPSGSPAVNIVIEGNFGFSTTQTLQVEEGISAGGRLLYSVVAEDNMNFYVGGGAGYTNRGAVETVRLQPTVAMDFFFFGLENLGFTAAYGLNVDVGGTSTGVSTHSAPSAGLTYWF